MPRTPVESNDDLLPFDSVLECAKCGGVEWRQYRVKYCAGGYALATRETELCYKITVEHLHRFCNACDYEWLERCKDSEPNQPQSELSQPTLTA